MQAANARERTYDPARGGTNRGRGMSAGICWRNTVRRSLLVLAALVATIFLAAGVVQAAKPGLTAGVGFNANTFYAGDTTALPDGSETVITKLVLPVNAKFMVDATVSVANQDQVNEADIDCFLKHGETVLDAAGVKLGPASDAGNTTERLAMGAAFERASDAIGINLTLSCSQANSTNAYASDAN